MNSSLEVNLMNRVPPQRTLEIMVESDVLIILTTDEKPSLYTLTGKLFDYMRSGAYIIGVSNDKAIAYGRFIEALGIGVSCSNDTSSLKLSFESTYELWVNNRLKPAVSSKKVEAYSRYNQNEKLVNWIKSS